MQQSKNKPDTLHGLTIAKDQTNSISSSNDNTEILEKHPIEGTPFWAIGNKDDGYHLVLGRYRLTQHPAENLEQLKEWMDNNTYHILLQMIIAVMNDREKQHYEKIPDTNLEINKTELLNSIK